MAATKLLSDNGVSSGITGYQLTGGDDGTLQLQTTTSGGTATTALTIDTSQNVGIGTSSPTAKLNLAFGVMRLQGGSTPYAEIYSGPGGSLYLASDAGNAGGNNMLFSVGGTERARIDSSGNLLVGVTSSVSSPANGICTTSPTGGTSLNVGHANGTPNGYAYMQYAYNGTTIGYISQNGTTAVAYNTTSDYRLKENIQPMQNALAVVQQLNPVTYNWKSDGSEGQGFIAHELQEVVPDCVTGEKDAVDADGNPQYQGIDTSFLVATLTAAIQEQQALITSLTARIAALEGAQQ